MVTPVNSNFNIRFLSTFLLSPTYSCEVLKHVGLLIARRIFLGSLKFHLSILCIVYNYTVMEIIECIHKYTFNSNSA